jgi:transposase
MRTHGSAQQLEQRRRKAIALLDEGCSPQEVAPRLRVSLRSVQRWRKAVQENGDEALVAVPHPGRASFLSDDQKEDLVDRLVEGAQSQGFDTDLWTCPRVKLLIERLYGVTYHVDHVSRLLHSFGFTPQKPSRRAVEREEEAIENWVRKDWPRIKKRRRVCKPTSSSRMKPAFCRAPWCVALGRRPG